MGGEAEADVAEEEGVAMVFAMRVCAADCQRHRYKTRCFCAVRGRRS